MLQITTKRPALGNVTVKIGEHSTTWHYRRISALEQAQLDEDMRPYKNYAMSRALAYQKNKEAVDRALTFAVSAGESELEDGDYETMEQLNRAPAVEVIAPLYHWLGLTLLRVDGICDENGEPLKWSDLDTEQRDLLCGHIAPTQVFDLLAKISRESQLSEMDLGK